MSHKVRSKPLWVFIVWNGEVRESGALVLRFCNTCPKSCRLCHEQTKAHESHPKGRVVTEQFVNRRDELLVQGNTLRTFPNNCKCGRALYQTGVACTLNHTFPGVIWAFKLRNPRYAFLFLSHLQLEPLVLWLQWLEKLWGKALLCTPGKNLNTCILNAVSGYLGATIRMWMQR